MEILNEALKTVLAKVGPVSGTTAHIKTVLGGVLYGVHVDITPKDLEVVIAAIHKIPNLLDHDKRVTSYELIQIFTTPENTHRFMFCCTLLVNGFGSKIFFVEQNGNYDRLRYQGEMKNIVLPKSVELIPDSPAPLKSGGSLNEKNDLVGKPAKPRAARKTKATKTVAPKETKPKAARKKRK